MADDIYQSVTRQPPYIEKRTEQLLSSVFGDPSAVQKAGESQADFELRKFGRSGVSQPIPAFKFAGFTPEQQQAFGLASSGIGSYAPYLQQAGAQMGLGAASQALGGGQLLAGTQAYSPTSAQAFMNPYQQNVTQEALKEYDRQAQIAQQGLASAAQKAGAFGGSRMAVQEAEMGRNLADIKSRRIFEDLSRNYQQAQGEIGRASCRERV